MHKLLFGAALLAVSVNVSAEGCLGRGFSPAEKQACMARIVANLPEETPEMKTFLDKQARESAERWRQRDAEASARSNARIQVIIDERERVAQIQAQQQAVAAQQRRDAVAEETLRQLQIQAAQAQQQQQQNARPTPVQAPTYRPPMRCNPRNGWCD